MLSSNFLYLLVKRDGHSLPTESVNRKNCSIDGGLIRSRSRSRYRRRDRNLRRDLSMDKVQLTKTVKIVPGSMKTAKIRKIPETPTPTTHTP